MQSIYGPFVGAIKNDSPKMIAPKELLMALLCFKIRRAFGLERVQIPLASFHPCTLVSFFLSS